MTDSPSLAFKKRHLKAAKKRLAKLQKIETHAQQHLSETQAAIREQLLLVEHWQGQVEKEAEDDRE